MSYFSVEQRLSWLEVTQARAEKMQARMEKMRQEFLDQHAERMDRQAEKLAAEMQQATLRAHDQMKLMDARLVLEEMKLKDTVLAAEQEEAAAPPVWAAFMLACVASKGQAEALLGDAETEYRKMLPKLRSSQRARLWYYVYVIKVAGRMMPTVMMRLLLLHKLLGLLGL